MSSLSPRETLIVRMLAEGDSVKEIATKLSIAPRTVEKHADRARLVLQAKNRFHLVALAIRAGIVAGDDGEPRVPVADLIHHYREAIVSARAECEGAR